jgi:GTPase SAR1 family protein
LLVGNKNDIQSEREVSFQEGKAVGKSPYLTAANEFNLRFIETSAKEALNITLAFQTLALDIMARFDSNPRNQ